MCNSNPLFLHFLSDNSLLCPRELGQVWLGLGAFMLFPAKDLKVTGEAFEDVWGPQVLQDGKHNLQPRGGTPSCRSRAEAIQWQRWVQVTAK